MGYKLVSQIFESLKILEIYKFFQHFYFCKKIPPSFQILKDRNIYARIVSKECM